MVAREYQVASRQLLRQAREELEQGDLRQASEKGWGAAAQMVKAIAAQRQWEHGGHRQIHRAARRLRSESGDREITRLFLVANSFHSNLYEDWLEAETIAEGLDDVERFLGLVEPLFSQT